MIITKNAKVDTFQLHLKNSIREFVKIDTNNTIVDTLLSSLKPKHRPLWPKFTQNIKTWSLFAKVNTEFIKTERNECLLLFNITEYNKVDNSLCSPQPNNVRYNGQITMYAKTDKPDHLSKLNVAKKVKVNKSQCSLRS